jgi:hypothetical protein
VWTVNARHDLSTLVRLGVEAIITDHLVDALAIVRGVDGRGGGDHGDHGDYEE